MTRSGGGGRTGRLLYIIRERMTRSGGGGRTGRLLYIIRERMTRSGVGDERRDAVRISV